MNKVILLGRLGQNPNIYETPDYKIGFLSLATNETWMRDGQPQQRTDWHSIKLLKNNDITFAQSYLNKGDQVMVEGKLQYRKTTKDEGQEVMIPEIVIANGSGTLRLVQKPKNQNDQEQKEQAHQDVETQNDVQENSKEDADSAPSDLPTSEATEEETQNAATN